MGIKAGKGLTRKAAEPEADFEQEPEKSAPTPAQTAPASAPSFSRSGPNKSQAVREAIAAGHDKPQDGVAWVKAQYDLDITPAFFSTIKTASKKGSTHVVRKPATMRPLAARPVVTHSRVGVIAGKDQSIDLAREVKRLISTYGSVAVSEMVSLFTE